MIRSCAPWFRGFPVMAIISGLVFACANDPLMPPRSQQPSAPDLVRPSSSDRISTSAAPRIRISSPTTTDYLSPGALAVSDKVLDFALVPEKGQPNAAGQGHIIYFMDAEAPANPGKPVFTAPGTWSSTSAPDHVWLNVQPGAHTISAELVNNDNTPLDPPAVARLDIEVKSEAIPPENC